MSVSLLQRCVRDKMAEDADVDYGQLTNGGDQGGILELLQDDDDDDGDNPEFKTLLELQAGVNRASATMLVSNAVFVILTVMNLAALALVASDAGPHPRIFNSDTREFVEKHGIVNIGIGNKASFLHEEDDLTDEEANPLENDDDVDE